MDVLKRLYWPKTTFLLRCPASTSALGRALCPADRGAKNCSLYAPFCHFRDIFPRSGGSLCSQAAVAILAFYRTGSHAAVDLILTQQEHDKGRDDGDDDTGADVVVLVAHGAGEHI